MFALFKKNIFIYLFFNRQVKFCIPVHNCFRLPDCDRGLFIPHQVTHLNTDFFVNAALFVLTFALPPWVKCWIWTLQKPTPAGDVKVTQVLFCVLASFGLCETSNRELVLSVPLSFSLCHCHPGHSFCLFIYLFIFIHLWAVTGAESQWHRCFRCASSRGGVCVCGSLAAK